MHRRLTFVQRRTVGTPANNDGRDAGQLKTEIGNRFADLVFDRRFVFRLFYGRLGNQHRDRAHQHHDQACQKKGADLFEFFRPVDGQERIDHWRAAEHQRHDVYRLATKRKRHDDAQRTDGTERPSDETHHAAANRPTARFTTCDENH